MLSELLEKLIERGNPIIPPEMDKQALGKTLDAARSEITESNPDLHLRLNDHDFCGLSTWVSNLALIRTEKPRRILGGLIEYWGEVEEWLKVYYNCTGTDVLRCEFSKDVPQSALEILEKHLSSYCEQRNLYPDFVFV